MRNDGEVIEKPEVDERGAEVVATLARAAPGASGLPEQRGDDCGCNGEHRNDAFEAADQKGSNTFRLQQIGGEKARDQKECRHAKAVHDCIANREKRAGARIDRHKFGNHECRVNENTKQHH